MGKQHSERLTRQHAKGMLDFSGTERMLAKQIIERLKHRLDPPKRPQLNFTDIRRETQRLLSRWFTEKCDNVLFKALIAGDKGPINLQSSANDDVRKGPDEG